MKKFKKAVLGLSMVLAIGVLSGCESWDRALKGLQSETGGGLERELKVYSEEGNLLFEDEGKFDIAVSESRVKYINEKGKLIIFYMGNSASVLVEEK